MKIMNMVKLSIVFGTLLCAAAGCKKSDNSTAPTQIQKEIVLQTSNTFGNYLVDKQNRTLYFFSNDPNGQDNCTGGCQAFWPIFNVNNLTADQVGDGLDFADFGSVTAPGGNKQISYKGWPLYYFAPLANGANVQEAPGKTQGDGVDGSWFVAKPDYSIMIVNAQLLGHDGKDYKSDYTEGLGTTTYFTDGKGLTLYTYKFDHFNKNNFTAADFSNNAVWPIYETSSVVVPSILDKTKFASISVFGRTQLTYQGWPLHYFGQDGNVRGLNKGVSFPTPAVWHVPVKDLASAPQ